MKNVYVRDLMTENPVLVSPEATLQQAAIAMRGIDCGILPVGTDDGLNGMITDRDIVIRAVSEGKDITKEQVKDYMTPHHYGCNENDTLEDAAEKMRSHKVSRLVVRNKSGKIVGILSFGGILRKNAAADDIANVVRHATGTRAI